MAACIATIVASSTLLFHGCCFCNLNLRHAEIPEIADKRKEKAVMRLVYPNLVICFLVMLFATVSAIVCFFLRYPPGSMGGSSEKKS